jgi:phage terminase large subunit-like protein
MSYGLRNLNMSANPVREAAEADLVTFINLIAPGRLLGAVHQELLHWWTRPQAKEHQLTLLPRDHGKSAMVAYRVAWELTKDPTLRVLYISATAKLAEKQLGFLKQILESDVHRRYWPDHIIPDKGRRAKWSNSEIELDHPRRKEEQIRDPSVMTAGLTTNIAGLHFDIAVLDDVVVYDNAYTALGRKTVETQYSFLASVEGTGAREWVVGTRYHPKDLYGVMQEMREPTFSDDGEITGEDTIYEVFERQVESSGDGTGEFLWPKTKRRDGKWFGFDIRELARKKAKYLDKTQFRAQYYNDPTDPDSRPVDITKFQYYDKKFLGLDGGIWKYKGKRLNLIASIDFAYSTRRTADYTAIVVVGVDDENNIYVLDIDRFKTSDIGEYFSHILHLSNKWSFRKLVAEVTAAQTAIVRSLKQDYFAPHGLSIKVEEVRPTRNEGSKEERMEAILTPRYDNLQIYHYRGGNCQVLEEELGTYNPPHDDVKDALASAIDKSVKPARSMKPRNTLGTNVIYNKRFGGRG